ncbi:MAG: hypothetical protein KatS3mg013_1143 [Actinomycetota bacterium]|jgi:geranylgeranyl diphosphate synthase type I|nr:MAG: hypothetical protein KatS3mg013_1143 [Actinomycetota bacterium]
MISAILRLMGVGAIEASEAIRSAVDERLETFLDGVEAELRAIDPACVVLVAELRRLLAAGGARLRPACCVLGFRAAGGVVGPAALGAAAALELLHTMALIHDDVMDRSPSRRGVAATHRWFADRSRRAGDPDPERVGVGLAVLVGDLAAVLSDRLLLECGFAPERTATALAVSFDVRVRMAAGQFLDLRSSGPDASDPELVAELKGGTYSIVGPLLIGATLAGGSPALLERLRRFGVPLGRAFQLADDLRDGDAAPGLSADRVRELVAQALAVLDEGALPPGVVEDLRRLATTIGASAEGR